MKAIIKGGIYRLLFMICNFLVGLFIATLGGAEMFGMISLMVVNAAVIHIITGFGGDSAIVWHGASNRFDKDKLFTFSFYFAFLQITLFVLISLLVYHISGELLLSHQSNDEYYYLELIYFCGLVLMDKYVSIMYSQQKAIQCNFILGCATFIGLLFLLLIWMGVVNIQISPFSFFCILTFIQAISLIIFYHLMNHVKFTRTTKEDTASFLTFSFIVFITNLVQFIAYRADFWLIDYFRDTEQVGIYSQANRFAQLLWVIPNILAGLLMPLITAKENSFHTDKFLQLIRVLIGMNIIAVAGVISSAIFFYSFFLQEIFYNGFRSLLFMLPGFYFFSITIILAAWFSARRLLWANFSVSAICFVTIISLDMILIPHYGIEGAAWSNTIGYTTATAISLYIFTRNTKMPLKILFRFRKDDWKLVHKF